MRNVLDINIQHIPIFRCMALIQEEKHNPDQIGPAPNEGYVGYWYPAYPDFQTFGSNIQRKNIPDQIRPTLNVHPELPENVSAPVCAWGECNFWGVLSFENRKDCYCSEIEILKFKHRWRWGRRTGWRRLWERRRQGWEIWNFLDNKLFRGY